MHTDKLNVGTSDSLRLLYGPQFKYIFDREEFMLCVSHALNGSQNCTIDIFALYPIFVSHGSFLTRKICVNFNYTWTEEHRVNKTSFSIYHGKSNGIDTYINMSYIRTSIVLHMNVPLCEWRCACSILALLLVGFFSLMDSFMGRVCIIPYRHQ